MPTLMSLEGPKVSHLDEIRSQLYAAVPRRWWRGLRGLSATTPPLPPAPPVTMLGSFSAHPWLLLFGVFGGAWLAGSKTGRRLLKR